MLVNVMNFCGICYGAQVQSSNDVITFQGIVGKLSDFLIRAAAKITQLHELGLKTGDRCCAKNPPSRIVIA